MNPRAVCRQLPLRLPMGAFFLNSGLSKWNADDTTAEQLHGEHTQVNYNAIPSVIYTMPEVAWTGLSEEQAKAKGYEVKVGLGPFAANGRAKAMEQAVGSIKVIADVKTDRILGMHMEEFRCLVHVDV